MQKKQNALTIGLLFLILAGIAPKVEGQTTSRMLSKNIEYDVKINNFLFIGSLGLEESNHSWFRDNIEASARGAFLELLFNQLKAGKLELYDLNDQRMDFKNIHNLMLASVDTIYLTSTRPPYESYDSIVPKLIPPEEITALRFREQWTYDPITLAVHKKVLAYAPVWTPITFDQNQREVYGKSKPLFWVKWSKEPANTKVLTKRIMSTVLFKSTDTWGKALNIDSIAIQKYTNRLLDKACNDSIDAYTVGMGDISDDLVSGKELFLSLNRIDTIRMSRTAPPKDMYDTIIWIKPHVDAIRTLEEWQFDPITMAIEKKVVGVCPIEQCFDELGEFKGFRVYFWVYFADIWMPLDGKLELKKK
jgi:hypothetical protein